MADMPQVGKAAPAFTLPSGTGETVSLRDLRGRFVVLYFYPRDNTPGCTQEACDFRDRFESLQKQGVTVLGVSTDTAASHEKFAAKYDLPFALLSDPDHVVAEKYGVWVEKQQYGRRYMGLQRATFLIDPKGKLAAVWPRVRVKGHVAEVAEKLAELGR